MLDYKTSPEHISVATDIWSLSASLFHIASGQFPFESSTLALARKNIFGKEFVSPDVRESAPGPIQKNITNLFAAVLAKGLEKDAAKRFCSASDMAMALQKCLVQQGSGVYSLYISFYGPPAMIPALLLKKLLDCHTTKGGKKIFVCLPGKQSDLGQENNLTTLSQGLIHSLVAVPILSNSMLDSMVELKGNDDDKPNRMLQELVLMQTLKASPQSDLVRIFPIYHESVSRQDISLGQLIPRPSPPVFRAVCKYLAAHGLSVSQELLQIVQKTVRTSISDCLHMLGAQLLDDPKKYATKAEMEITNDDRYFELLKTYVPEHKLPSKSEISILVSKLRCIAEDLCKVLDEVHADWQQNQVQKDAVKPIIPGTNNTSIDQFCIGKHEIAFVSDLETTSLEPVSSLGSQHFRHAAA
jgi:hypothetical protein